MSTTTSGVTIPRPPQEATIDPAHPCCVWLREKSSPLVAPDEGTARRLAAAWNAAAAPIHDREEAAHDVLELLHLRYPQAGIDLLDARDVVGAVRDRISTEQWCRLNPTIPEVSR